MTPNAPRDDSAGLSGNAPPCPAPVPEERVELPPRTLGQKNLSPEDFETVRRQWELVLGLSGIRIPNEIDLRRRAGLPELATGTLAHGTEFSLEKMRSIAREGVVSGELLGIPEDGETNYCADFFRVPHAMDVAEYVGWYDDLEPQPDGSSVVTGRMERNYLTRARR